MAGEIAFYMKTHVWIPMLVGVGSVVLIVVIGIIALLLYKKCSRYDYTPLLEDLALPDKLQMERQMERDAIREGALLNCQFYLRSRSGRYSYSEQLPDMGTRLEKHWFLVQYPRQKRDLLLSICTKSPRCPVPFNNMSQKTLQDLFKAVKHPYVWPVQDIEFLEEQDLVVVLQPYSSRGSLKDYIFNVKPNNAWESKVSSSSKGLGNKQIQVFGRQILEGLLYLQSNSFPNHCHVHSGNVIVDRNCCKISGYENVFLGYTSKLYPTIRRKLKDNPGAIDVLAFGHILFEMSSGYELNEAFPDRTHLTKLHNPEIVQILEYIFDANGSYPSLQEVADHEFFANVKLPELIKHPPSEINFNSSMKAMIKSIKKGKSFKSQSSRRTPGPKTGGKSSRRGSKEDRAKRSTPSPRPSEKLTTQQPSPTPPPPPPSNAPAPPPPPPMTVGYQPPANLPPVPEGRGALLGDIRKGITLKKTATNDRSNPKV